MKEINKVLANGWMYDNRRKCWCNPSHYKRYQTSEQLGLTPEQDDFMQFAEKKGWRFNVQKEFWFKSYQEPKSTKELFDLYNQPFKVLGTVKRITEEPELNGQTVTLTNYRAKFFNRSCVIEEGTPYILTVDRNNVIINVNQIK